MQARECSLVEPLLGAYLDGELSAETVHRVTEHLESCKQCQAVLRKLHHVDSVFRRAAPPEVAPEIWDAMETRLVAYARRKRYHRVARRAAVAAACVLVLAAAAYLAGLFSRGPEVSSLPGAGPVAAQGESSPEPPLQISVERP